MIKSLLKNLKNRIKAEPIILLKKPWLVFLIPLVLVYMICYRLRSSTTVVYLTESKLDELLTFKNKPVITGNTFSLITSPECFNDCKQKRILEDNEVGELFGHVLNRRFESGDFAIVYLDQQLIPLSYVFICTRQAVFTPVGITLSLPKGIFGMYDVYTFSEARGKGYYADLFYYSIDLMMQRGFRKMWLWLMKHNSVSVDVHYKLGIRKINKISRIR